MCVWYCLIGVYSVTEASAALTKSVKSSGGAPKAVFCNKTAGPGMPTRRVSTQPEYAGCQPCDAVVGGLRRAAGPNKPLDSSGLWRRWTTRDAVSRAKSNVSLCRFTAYGDDGLSQFDTALSIQRLQRRPLMLASAVAQIQRSGLLAPFPQIARLKIATEPRVFLSKSP